MPYQDRDVKNRLLEAGMEEFREYGFRGASLRRICKAAGVTTGALYFFFENKEDLFCQIIEKPLAVFNSLMEKGILQEWNDPDDYDKVEDEIICFLMKYKRECILILEKADGTKYKNYGAKIQTELEKTFLRFFNHFTNNKADPVLVHLIAVMRFRGYMELVYGDYSLEKARKLVKDMGCYADAGFKAIIEKINREVL